MSEEIEPEKTAPSTKEAQAPKAEQDTAYQVLARKYRPRNFDDLIGQEAMVRTLSNAFETGRIAHAFMLTGVRGVGKTTTARILARAFNYATDGVSGLTVKLDAMGDHCQSIMDGNHIDIIEMDAASRTGIGDIREIIANVSFMPASARYKVYIIDEVHMLSTAAFNGLLKTLEEPPEHVKFIFATTEIRKVPVTVLSRCQRFDLRRLDQDETLKLLNKVCKAEGVSLSAESLMLIARAAEGSARDALSLLDRALAHGGAAGVDNLSADDMRNMLGLADRARVFDLFDFLMQGKIAEALEEFAEQFRMGADPAIILADLIALTHWLTRLKYVPSAAKDITIAEAQRVRGVDTAKTLSVRILSRAWQVLLKGHAETLTAPNPMAAAEMVLIRLAHLADMPSPEELLKQWDDTPSDGGGASSGAASDGGSSNSGGSNAPSNTPSNTASNAPSNRGASPLMAVAPQIIAQVIATPSTVKIANFEQLVAFVGEMRDIRLKHALEQGAHLVRFEPATDEKGGVVEIRLAPAQEDFSRDLTKKLREWTAQTWLVSLSKDAGADTIKQVALSAADARRERAAQDPMVKQALALFAGADIASVTDLTSDFEGDFEADASDGSTAPDDIEETDE